MRRPLNLLYVGPGFHQGGMQQSVLNLFRGLDAKRFRPMACGVENSGAIGAEIEAAGFEVVNLGLVRRPIPTILALISLMRQRQIDIAHAANFYSGWVARLAAIIARVPVRVMHEHTLFDRKRWARVLINRLLDPFTDGVITVSQAVKGQLISWYGYADDKIEVIYNGVDLAQFSPVSSRSEEKKRLGLDPDRPVVGMISRLLPSKGHRYFFEAIRELLDRVDVQWIVVGTGAKEHEDQIRREAKVCGIDHVVQFVGMQRNVSQWLGSFDVYVLPTLQEGGPPISVLEAMAMACPVVVSDCPTNLEGVEHERTGLIVARKDSAGLARAIEALLVDAELRARLGIEARRHVERSFSVERYVQRTSQYYEELWAKHERKKGVGYSNAGGSSE